MRKLPRGPSEGQKQSWTRQLFCFDNMDERQPETSGLSAHPKAASVPQLLVLLKGFPLPAARGVNALMEDSCIRIQRTPGCSTIQRYRRSRYSEGGSSKYNPSAPGPTPVH